MAKVSIFRTRVAGVSHYQDVVTRCYEGQEVALIRDPDNEHDENAIMVCHDDQIGFISRDEAEGLAPAMDHGDRVEAHIDKLTGGTPDKSTTGVILQVTITPASLLEEG